MKKTKAAFSTLCGALVSTAVAAVPSSAQAASAVAEMSPAELRFLFRTPGLIVADGLGSYNEDYRWTASKSERRPESSGVAVSGADRETICVALGDALNYLRGRALASRRVAYGSDTGILRWYNSHCLRSPRAETTAAAKAPVDAATLESLRRIVSSRPYESLDAY